MLDDVAIEVIEQGMDGVDDGSVDQGIAIANAVFDAAEKHDENE
ncbi:hypothetical protein [Martelella alba]|nr:hypothetical protein [Martelella alba]